MIGPLAYAPLLASPEVRRLLAGSMIARLPSAMLPLAILLLVVESGASITAAGVTAGAYGVGRAAASPVVGALVDRFGQAKVLVAGALAQAAALAAVIAVAEAHAPGAAIAAVALSAGATQPPVQAALRATWPLVVADARRDAAYSFDATTQELIWIAGPLLVAAILGFGSAALAIAASAVLAGAGITVYVSAAAARKVSDVARAGWFTLRAARAPAIRMLIAVNVCTGFAWGALTLGLSASAVVSGSARLSGVLLAALSAGSIAGGLTYGSRTWPGAPLVRFRLLLVACAVLPAPLLFVPGVAAAVPLSILAGVPLAPLYAVSYLLTGREAPAGATTEAFTWTSSAFALGVAAGTAAGGVVSQPAGVWAAFALACAAPIAALALTFPGAPAPDSPAGVTGRPQPPYTG